MKNTKIKGFSLAEVMIAMLVISIALAAAIPTITKRNAGSDNIWRAGTQTVGGATEEDANTLAFTGPNILIGASRLPLLSNDRYFEDSRFNDGLRISPKDDKLIIFKEIEDPADRFKSSHIGLYNSPTEYAGRLASDKYNLALGIGTLQSLQPDYSEAFPQGAYNTAIGQYALLTNRQGSYNTAFGYNALRGNAVGSVTGNIALGYNTLINVENGSNNNIAIGSDAGRHITGSNNILVGPGAGNLLTGSDNILITLLNAYDPVIRNLDSNYVTDVLLNPYGFDLDRYPAITDNDNFAIGRLNVWTDSNPRPPVMQGFTKTQLNTVSTPCNGAVDGICHAKGLIINADNFSISTKKGNPIFAVLNDNTPIVADSLTGPPCNGAPVCLARFNVTTASYYTNDLREDWLGNNYSRTSTYPRFQQGNINNTELPNNPVYDLFIGSFTYGAVGIEDLKDEDEAEKAEKEEKIDSAFDLEQTKKPIDHNHEQYSNHLIDVGKRETTDGLQHSRLSGVYAENSPIVLSSMDDAGRPASLIDSNSAFTGSLKIRTVKTAVNFLDEFKEKSNWIDIMLLQEENAIRNLFNRTASEDLSNVAPCSSSGEPSDWEQVVECDPCLYEEHGMGFLANFCRMTYNTEQRVENTGRALRECLVEGALFDGYFGCVTEKIETFQAQNDTRTCPTSSDARLKNIAGDNTAGLDEINKLQVYNYTYKADKSQTPHVGVMAQDLKKVFPNAVKKGSDGYYRIRLEDMFYAMVNSVKELTKKKDELNTLTVDYIDAPLSELEKQNADIKAQNDLLKQKNEEIEKRLSQMEAK